MDYYTRKEKALNQIEKILDTLTKTPDGTISLQYLYYIAERNHQLGNRFVDKILNYYIFEKKLRLVGDDILPYENNQRQDNGTTGPTNPTGD